MPPLPTTLPGPTRRRDQVVGQLVDVLEQSRLVREPGVGVVETLDVGEQHHQVGVDHRGDQRGERVVVAEADLVDGDGVVLVDHRHRAECQQPLEGVAGVQERLAVPCVVTREQHLADRRARAPRSSVAYVSISAT